MLKVNFFYREPRKTGFSIEGIFKLMREGLKGTVEVEEFYCDAKSSRWGNIANARRHSGRINHITGDVNFLALGLFGKKNVLTIHDFGYYENPVHSPLVKFVYSLIWFRLPLMFIDRVTVVSMFTKEKLVRYFKFPIGRIHVIPNPVKPIFQPSPKTSITEKPVVLMMGTGKHKNLQNLIEALSDTGYHLDIIGWPDSAEIERLERARISYKVYNGLSDTEVYDRYKACDVLFMASFYEGFGMPIIEAQSVGRPVVTSNLGAMKEGGEGSTILVDPNDVVAIRECITSLVTDKALYDKYVWQGYSNAAKYDYKKIAGMYADVYRELDKLNAA